jgi:hypothetical protein
MYPRSRLAHCDSDLLAQRPTTFCTFTHHWELCAETGARQDLLMWGIHLTVLPEGLGRLDLAWLAEAKRRRDEVRSSRASTIPASEAVRKVRDALKQ